MFDIRLIRTWIGISLAWPLIWALVFNRWFFLSPLGLFIAFGIPIAGWVIWWKFYEGNGEKLLAEGRLVLGKGSQTLLKVKKPNQTTLLGILVMKTKFMLTHTTILVLVCMSVFSLELAQAGQINGELCCKAPSLWANC